MTTIAVDGSMSQQINRDAAIKKVWRRLIPFLFVLYIFNYLDRINIGFAALSMNKDLLLTATTFGLANSIFYVGYVACEIPSNLLMVRYGARVWIAAHSWSHGDLLPPPPCWWSVPTASIWSAFWWACWRPASCRASCSI